MAVIIVVGGQWGDEGKGKVVDTLAGGADVVVRATGGSNAGHTIVNEHGTFALHLVPAGIFRPCLSIIGNGVVIEPAVLFRELDDLMARGIDLAGLRISDRAHIVLPFHRALDLAEEEASGAAAIGTTGTGNGPAHADKVARRGLRVADLLDEAALAARLGALMAEKNALLGGLHGQAPVDGAALFDECRRAGERLRPYVAETERLIQAVLARGGSVLMEGAQGALLDIDFGTYPFVTSSSPSAAGMCAGAGVAPTQVSRVVGVYKAYTSRVGNGPFPTEQINEIGQLIRTHAQEYGTTTGRPRRIGWFDAAACRTVLAINGIGEAALTRLDILDEFPALQIATGYRLDGQTLDHLPARADLIERLEPIYEGLPGWQAPIAEIRRYADLPANARAYVERVEALLGVPVTMIGVGPARHQLIER